MCVCVNAFREAISGELSDTRLLAHSYEKSGVFRGLHKAAPHEEPIQVYRMRHCFVPRQQMEKTEFSGECFQLGLFPFSL